MRGQKRLRLRRSRQRASIFGQILAQSNLVLAKPDRIVGRIQLLGQPGAAQLALQVDAICVGQQRGERAFLERRILEVLFVRLVDVEQ